LWLLYLIVLCGLSSLLWFFELYPDVEAEAEFLTPLQLDSDQSAEPIPPSEFFHFAHKHDKNRPVAIVAPFIVRPPSPLPFGLGHGQILNLIAAQPPNTNPPPLFFYEQPDSVPDS